MTNEKNNVIEFVPTKTAKQVFAERLSMIGEGEMEEVLRRISAAVAMKQQNKGVAICA